MISGQIIIDVPGTTKQGPATPIGAKFAIKAHPGNTGNIFIGDVESGGSTTFPLAAGDTIIRRCLNMATLVFDADAASQRVSWFVMES